MVKQMNTQSLSIIRKHTWQVPFRVSMYEIEDGRKFVLLEGGKRKPAPQAQPSRTDLNMPLSAVSANQANNPWTIRNC